MTQGKYETGRRPAYPVYAPIDETRSADHRLEEMRAYRANRRRPAYPDAPPTDKTRSVYHHPEEIHAYQAKNGARPHFAAQARIGGMAMDCRCSKYSVENSFSHTKGAVNEKANSIQLVDHTQLFWKLYYFINNTAWVGRLIKNDMDFLEENSSRVVDGDQGMINEFHRILDNGSMELSTEEANGLNLQQGPDGFNNFLPRVEQQLREFNSSNLAPTYAPRRAINYFIEEDWIYWKPWLCQNDGREYVFMPYDPPHVGTLIRGSDINYMATEFQHDWALNIGINDVGTVRTNLEGIRVIYEESSLFSVKAAMSSASADNGFKLRFNIRNARGRAESLLSLLASMDLINWNTDVKMRGCW